MNNEVMPPPATNSLRPVGPEDVFKAQIQVAIAAAAASKDMSTKVLDETGKLFAEVAKVSNKVNGLFARTNRLELGLGIVAGLVVFQIALTAGIILSGVAR